MKNKEKKIVWLIAIVIFIQLANVAYLGYQNVQLRNDIDSKDKILEEKILKQFEEYQIQTQSNFQEISNTLTSQETNFQKQLSMIKSSSGDFSGVIEQAVKGVVNVGTEYAIGTGFMIDNSGYVVTNEHVISGARNIKIVTYDKQAYQARLIGKDKIKDLALLKVEGSFSSLKLGDSDDVQVGNKVIAIGNPLGLSFTVTEGIVSALNREGSNGINDYIQTDVSLNPGNSGGPLINSLGEVIGINNFKVSGADNIGFALESNSVRTTINKLSNQTLSL